MSAKKFRIPFPPIEVVYDPFWQTGQVYTTISTNRHGIIESTWGAITPPTRMVVRIPEGHDLKSLLTRLHEYAHVQQVRAALKGQPWVALTTWTVEAQAWAIALRWVGLAHRRRAYAFARQCLVGSCGEEQVAPKLLRSATAKLRRQITGGQIRHELSQ